MRDRGFRGYPKTIVLDMAIRADKEVEKLKAQLTELELYKTEATTARAYIDQRKKDNGKREYTQLSLYMAYSDARLAAEAIESDRDVEDKNPKQG